MTKNNRIYLSPPHMGEQEKKFLLNAFNSNWITSLGPHVDAFEREMADYLDVQHTCALSSGTAALHIALRILGVGKGDIVLCPSLTFAASANVILYENATPAFVDVSPNSWVIDLFELEVAMKKLHPKALITVDLYGQSCDYDAITKLCEKYNVFLIEDAAEALGSNYKNKKCSSFGQMGILSFNGNKIMTTSGGGMLVSENEKYIKKARFLATQARELKIHYEHKELGYNYRLSNLLAAVGRGQLLSLDDFVTKKRNIFNRYYDSLSLVKGFEFMQEADCVNSNRWLTTLTINPHKAGVDRNKIIKTLEDENIESRPVWKPMHMQPLYKSYSYINNNKDVSRNFYDDGLCLPSGTALSENEQTRIIDIILNSIKK